MRSVNGNLLKFFVGSVILYQGCLQSIPNQYSRPSSNTARQFQLILKLSIGIRQFFSCLSIQNYAPFNRKIHQPPTKKNRYSHHYYIGFGLETEIGEGINPIRQFLILIIHQGEYSISAIQLDAKSRILFLVFCLQKEILVWYFFFFSLTKKCKLR